MTEAPGDVGGDLCGRLEELLAAARAAGRLPELEPALRAALAEAREAAAPAPEDGGTERAGGVPMRFGMVGDSPKMRDVFALLERVARAEVPVLVQGETGTGKELVARALHEHGARAGKPFVAENCAAVPGPLLESELFGHTKGSFTGAIADRDGHFVAADGGTIFLDEVGDMPLEMQAKLLRVLESGEVRPVGSSRTRKVDVRVVAATNKDLAAMAAQKAFRQDLYYRLNVVSIELPPLRERNGDVAHLVRYFLEKVGREMGVPEVEVTDEALEVLEAYRWPGNVRELENEIRRSLALTGGRILRSSLSPALSAAV